MLFHLRVPGEIAAGGWVLDTGIIGTLAARDAGCAGDGRPAVAGIAADADAPVHGEGSVPVVVARKAARGLAGSATTHQSQSGSRGRAD